MLFEIYGHVGIPDVKFELGMPGDLLEFILNTSVIVFAARGLPKWGDVGTSRCCCLFFYEFQVCLPRRRTGDGLDQRVASAQREMCSVLKPRETSVGPCRGPWLRFYPALLRHSSISCSAALFCQRKCASLMCCGATPICFYVCFLSWHLGSCGVENAGVHSGRRACWPACARFVVR